LLAAVRATGQLEGLIDHFEIAFAVCRFCSRAGLGAPEIRPLLAAVEREEVMPSDSAPAKVLQFAALKR
jgi:hypothetical protein